MAHSRLRRAAHTHAQVVLAVFASLLAPFGGFFASGFKRGFKIKDFGDSIPGHGGVTDRFDCQVRQVLVRVGCELGTLGTPYPATAASQTALTARWGGTAQAY